MSPWRERMKAHGQVPRSELEPYRVAGGGVYDYVLELDTLRAGDLSQPGVQAALLAGWVAFALQLLGDEMLTAGATLDPSSADYIPPATAQQVSEFYQPVQAWMARAASAKVNPSYQIDVPLPEVLPIWVDVVPSPPAHLLALHQAVTRLREHTEGLVSGFNPPLVHAREIVAAGMAEAGSAADYADRMWGAADGLPPAQTHPAIEAHLRHAAESYFYIGQVIAMPSLADAPRRVRATPPEQGGPRSFLESMAHAYPQVAQRPRGGGGSALAGIAGGLLAGLVGGEILGGIGEAIGGGGGWGDNDGGWGGGGDWGN